MREASWEDASDIHFSCFLSSKGWACLKEADKEGVVWSKPIHTCRGASARLRSLGLLCLWRRWGFCHIKGCEGQTIERGRTVAHKTLIKLRQPWQMSLSHRFSAQQLIKLPFSLASRVSVLCFAIKTNVLIHDVSALQPPTLLKWSSKCRSGHIHFQHDQKNTLKHHKWQVLQWMSQ